MNIIPDNFQTGPDIRIKTISLASARDNQELTIFGNAFWIVSGDSGATLSVKFTQDSDPVPAGPGFFLHPIGFKKVWLTNTAQSGKSVTIAYWYDPRKDIETANTQ